MTAKKRKDELKRIADFPLLEEDDHTETSGVLLSDEIKFYVDKCKLIYPFDFENLKPASYELTVGDEAVLGGKHRKLGDSTGDGQPIIPPFQVAVVKTGETLNLPRFLIARWNIRVSWAYKGLLWVGGPQVDPGYVGNLFCPLYNLSDQDVRLRKGEPIAVIDFVKTTGFDIDKGSEKWERYPRPPTRVIIDDYGVEDFSSALYTLAKDKLNFFEKSLNTLQNKFDSFTLIVFGVLAFLVSALAILFQAGNSIPIGTSIWGGTIFSISFFALVTSIFSVFSSRRPSENRSDKLLIHVALIGLAAIVVGVVAYIVIETSFDGLESTVTAQGNQLESLLNSNDELVIEIKDIQRRLKAASPADR